MKLKVRNSRIMGEISVPGSKSHTIRAIAVATVAKGISHIRNPLVSGDTISSLNAARLLGAEVKEKKDLWSIQGTGGNLRISPSIIDLGNSGTGLRIFTGLAATSVATIKFDGDDSLRTRPMAPLLSALEKLGVKTESTGGKCPISVTGPMKGGETTVEGKSSQFLTSLLFAAPLAPNDTVINVVKLNEIPYVEITIDWLKKQNIRFEYTPDFSIFRMKGGQSYKSFSCNIPADFSTATFPLVAAAITGGEVKIRNLDFEDRQGDKAVFNYMEQMGVTVRRGSEWTVVCSRGKLHGIEIDLNSTPDALPAMAVAASFAKGKTTLKNVPQARIKESDRIACMTRELRKMGVEVIELEDGMIIQGGCPHAAEVEGYNDHRIVMALTIAGLSAKGETVVNGAEAAAITYPSFVEDFKSLGALIEVCN